MNVAQEVEGFLAKGRAPGCANAAGRGRQKWQAIAGTKFTKPGAPTLADICKLSNATISNETNRKRKQCLADGNDFANKEIPGYGDKRFTGQVGVSVAEAIHYKQLRNRLESLSSSE